jgi:glycosyltransferase involved in cell wall biosynthesis
MPCGTASGISWLNLGVQCPPKSWTQCSAEDTKKGMRILFLSRWFPYPPDNGSRIRVFNLIKHLSLHHRVDLISFASDPVADEQVRALDDYCQLVRVVRHRPFHPGRLTALMGIFSRRPRSVIDTHSAEMQRQVEEVGRDRSPDVVIASQLDMAPYAIALSTVPKILLFWRLRVHRHTCHHITRCGNRGRRYRYGWRRGNQGCSCLPYRGRRAGPLYPSTATWDELPNQL